MPLVAHDLYSWSEYKYSAVKYKYIASKYKYLKFVLEHKYQVLQLWSAVLTTKAFRLRGLWEHSSNEQYKCLSNSVNLFHILDPRLLANLASIKSMGPYDSSPRDLKEMVGNRHIYQTKQPKTASFETNFD